MTELLIEYSYISMFILGFLAATVLPIASEWLLSVLLVQGADAVGVVIAGTLGNFLGALTTYGVGYYFSDYALKKLLKLGEKKRRKTENFYHKYGAYSLLLSWAPVVGDILCLIGGLMKISIFKFSFFVFIGKLLRYSVLAMLILKSIEMLK